jgi:hypothetical protein
VERLLSRAAILLAAIIAAIILLSIATLFLCGALYLYLVSASVAPPLAALLAGLATVLAAGLIMLGVGIMSRRRTEDRRAHAVPSPVGQANDLATNLAGLAAREFTSLAQAHPYRASILALLGGLAIGGRPELRETLKKMLQG